MSTLLIACLSFFGFILAYHTYGKFVADKLFGLRPEEPVPSVELRDDVDYLPTNRFVLFGHHFTTIAGTGPIVGPAIAILWGWLPALLWVLFGCIFIGAVHDFSALVLSVRNKGMSLGSIAGQVLSPSARLLFLVMLVFILSLVVAVFCSVMASMFNMFPASVVPCWISLPLAMIMGLIVYKWKMKLLLPSLIALLALFFTIWLATYYLPQWKMPGIDGMDFFNPTMNWVLVLLVYCFFASTLPVWLLLQPRDYINSQLLFVTMIPVVIGLFFAALMGSADMVAAAPAIRNSTELKNANTPPILPFLFITVACGAASGFHAMTASGTSSKQLASMKDARFIGYGGMLMEGALAVVVIIACTAGIGMGTMGKAPYDPTSAESLAYKAAHPEAVLDGHIDAFTLLSDGMKTERSAWDSWYSGKWSDMNLGEQLGVFVEGASNFLEGIGIPPQFAHTLMAVMIVCFAATTVDSATRLLRYVIQELSRSARIPGMNNRYLATIVAVALAGVIASSRGIRSDGSYTDYGTGGMILWPLFGASNQVVVGLTLLIAAVYLLRKKIPTIYLMIPAVLMLCIPLWAMLFSMLEPVNGWLVKKQYFLAGMGSILIFLVFWLILEAARAIKKLKTLDQADLESVDQETKNI